MKKKLGIRALAAILAASVVMSASTGMVSAKNGASVSATDVSDTSVASETTTRAAAKKVSANVSVEGAALNSVKAPAGLNGIGTTASPYQIGSLSDLLLMNSYINYEPSSLKEFVLTSDIDLSKVTFSHFTNADGIWSLVSAKASLSGNANVRFHLNGNGHKLYGMNASVSKNVSTGAIFGYINQNSVIENLTVESCTLRVNNGSDGAFAVFAVQNCGTITNCTMIDCVFDARLGSVETRSTDEGVVSVSGAKVYVGHAIGVADNAGKVTSFTVTGSDSNKGVFVKGGRRFVGVVAGQNRKTISDVSVSGVRILSYGSEDDGGAITGGGETAAYIGVVAGRNDKSATVSSATVAFKYGADILCGDAVGGIAGDNAGTIADSSVTGTNATGSSVSSTTANLYGCGRYGAIAGINSGTVRDSGAYDVGFCFAKNDAQNAYGGVAGANSGAITSCAATGSVNLQNAASAGVGGLIGYVQSGTTLQGNYAVVSAGKGANVGALLGKDGATSYIGQSNYWTSLGSGISTPVPDGGAGQNDLTASKRVIVLTKSTKGVTIQGSALSWNWQDGKVTAAADLSKVVSVSNQAIRLNKTANSVTLVCTQDGVVGELSYTVSASVPAGAAGHKLTARVSVPVYATASAANGAGATVQNPVVISNAAQMQIMQYAPNAHYKLDADITLGSDWKPVDFGGTLNGNGHTLRISKPIFSSVTGSRDGAVSDENWKYVGSNLISGYIYDMTIVPATCVYGGVFGDVKNATLRDVTYTVTDENDGFVALSAAKSGALIDTLSGNAFLYRCKVSVPIAVTADKADGIGALVGYAHVDQLIAENCETSSLISLEKNPANVGGLFGSIDGSAELTGCCATGCVYVPAAVSEVYANIMVGAASNGVTASGCTYSIPTGVAGGSVSKTAAPFTDGIDELNPQSEEAKQGVEDAQAMLSLIDSDLIEEAPLNGDALTYFTGNNKYSTEVVNGVTYDVYKLSTPTDVTTMMHLINQTDGTSAADSETARAATTVFELQTDIDMNHAALKMATSPDKAFCGTFRSSSGNQWTLSNFTVTTTGTDTTDARYFPDPIVYETATALFCYANGAKFQDFKLSGVTVQSDGVGTAVLVGIADICYDDTNSVYVGDYSECSFTNIDILNCNVYSNFTPECPINNTTGLVDTSYYADRAALAGTLIGAAWSGNAGDLYTITGITVSDCSVINRNWDENWAYYANPNDYTDIGGSWAIGGLIGGSRLTDGTLCIGEAGNDTSVTLEHITVVGYGGVGGVIGIAGPGPINGAATSVTSYLDNGSPKAYGGIAINRVEVCGKTVGDATLRSSITAGNGGGQGGSCGGILGVDCVSADTTNGSYASVGNCTVSDTDILSDNDISTMTSSAVDTGGICGHMSGTVANCTVDHCTIKSCVAGGIVGRSSRKMASNVGTRLTLNGCQVKGNTTIGYDGHYNSTNQTYTSANAGEGGGLVASARNASVTIQNCSIGSTVTVSSAHWKYLGGFIGYAESTGSNNNSVYAVNIQNSITNATVSITASITDSAVGGAVGYEGMYHIVDSTTGGTTMSKMVVKNCVLGGTLSDMNYFCGGVFGCLKAAQGTPSSIKMFDIEECAVTATLSADTTVRAKLVAFYAGAATVVLNGNTRWMYSANVNRAVKRTVFSSYPQDLECIGYYRNGSNYILMGNKASNLAHLKNSGSGGLIAKGCVEDVNKPSHLNSTLTGDDASKIGTVYISGETSALELDGKKGTANETRTFTVTMNNFPQVSSLVTFDNSDGASPNANQQYAGWVSSNLAGDPVNNTFSVLDTSQSNSVNISAKLDSDSVGLKGHFTVTGFTDADTSAPAQFAVYVPLELTQVPPPGLDGNGSANNPWQIHNLDDLNSLRSRDLTKNASSSGTDKGYYILVPQDSQGNSLDYIDASGSGFEPIVDQSHSDGPFCGTFNGNGKTITGLTINSANTGLFKSTSGATIHDLTIAGAHVAVSVDTTSVPNVIAGNYAAALVGTATNTTFRNITFDDSVNGNSTRHTEVGGTSSIYPTVYAGVLAAYATDCTAQNITLENATVRYAYFTGGLYGHAHYTTSSTGNKIQGVTINGLSVTSTSTQGLNPPTEVVNPSTGQTEIQHSEFEDTYQGKIDAAGGIAAEFAGTIGKYTTGNVANTIQSIKTTAPHQIGGFEEGETAVYETVTLHGTKVAVSGSIASGVVGIVDQTLTTASVCSISDVTIGSDTACSILENGKYIADTSAEVTVTSERTLANRAAAGGIVGKVSKEDPSGGADTNPGVQVTLTDCAVMQCVTISARLNAGGILGHSGANGAASPISLTRCSSLSSVSEVLPDTNVDAGFSANAYYIKPGVGSLAGRVYDIKHLRVDYCVAGGSLTATSNAGGIVGVVPFNNSGDVPAVADDDGIRISNTVFSATLSVGTGGLRGVLFGSVKTAQLPTGLTNSPFSNIYYSSYQVPSDMLTTVNNVIKIDKLSGENAYTNYQATCIDLMTDFGFAKENPNADDDPNTDDEYIYTSSIRVPREGVQFSLQRDGANSISLWSDIEDTNGTLEDNYEEFSCPSAVHFILDTVVAEQNKVQTDLITFDKENGKVLAKGNDSGDLVFIYQNGLKLKLDMIASDIKGEGTSNDPFLIERIGHLNTIKAFPSAYYILAADIDFNVTDANTTYYTAHGNEMATAGWANGNELQQESLEREIITDTEKAWASHWEDWATSLTRTDKQNGVYLYRFTGTLDGEQFAYSYSTDSYATSGAKTKHEIKNLTVTTDGLNNSTVTDNSNVVHEIADFTGVGFFPVIEEGATVKNIKFSNCNFTATSTAGVYNANKGLQITVNNVQTRYVYENDAGVLAAVNRGKIQGVIVDNCKVVSKTQKSVAGSGNIQAHHVGAIAGVSYATYTENNTDPVTYTVDANAIENCTVQNSKVTSSHCAGGIVGGGASVSGCAVTGTIVTGTDYAGGIAGGNLNYAASYAEEVAQNNGAKNAMQACTYTNCSVKACTIGSAYQTEDETQPDYALAATTANSSVGGILGIAEAGDSSTYGYRSVAVTHCTVDCQANSHRKDTTAGHTNIYGYADTSDQNGQENFAGGMIGQIVDYYDGVAVENCASYAGVYACGDYSGNACKTAASALVGSVAGGNNFKAYVSNTVTIRFLNNVCGGDLHSAYIAGGVCGLFAANSSGYQIPANARFACGNIISASFELMGEVMRGGLTTYNRSSDGFGVMIGVCTPVSDDPEVTIVGSFATDAAPSTMKENYYSSYVSKIGSSPIPHFSVSKGDVTDCDGLYDVAAYTGYDSSFLVKNYKYNMTEHEGGSVTWTLDESTQFEDTVTAPEYHDDVNDVNVYPGHNDPNHTDSFYNMTMQLMFNKDSGYSPDFADPTNTLTVDSANLTTTGQNPDVAHILSLTDVADIYVTPNAENEFYSGEKALSAGTPQKSTVKLTINRDPAECDKSYFLIADLDYGLLVGITIKTPTGTGEKKDPYRIKNAAEFCHYFFEQNAVMATDQLYLTRYYAQTDDISFDAILKTIAMTDQENYPKYDQNDVYGYRKETGSGAYLTYTFVSGQFAPIGTENSPFTGGYNGGWTTTNNENGVGHRIYDFHYTATNDRSDVGLFGYVSDKTTAAEGDHRLKNIHIELLETALDTDDYIPNPNPQEGENTTIAASSPTDAMHAGVFGGNNAGGLAGVYASNCDIENCSVVYGTVSSDNPGANVGGLFGKVQGTAAMQHCFTSVNVRVRDHSRQSSEYGTREDYTCGGLVGLQESNALSAVSCKYDNCFCSSDVVGPYFVGSFVGKVGLKTHIELTNCASTATVTGLSQLINRDSLVTSIVVGLTPFGTGFKGYAVDSGDTDPNYVKAVNVYVAGMNTVEYKHRTSSEQHYATLFGPRPLLSGSSGIYYDASTLGRVTLPNGTSNPYIIRVTGEVRSKSDAALQTAVSSAFVTNATDKKTDAEHPLDGLTDTDHPLGNSGYFDTSIDGLYPVLQMKTRTGYSKDPYFAAFSKLSALPMRTDDRELDDESSLRTYVGVTYPTTVAKTLGVTHAAEYVPVLDENNQPVLDENDQPQQRLVRAAYTAPALSIVASKYSAASDTVAYDSNYDYLLEGNSGRSDMQTDLLFDMHYDDYRLLRNTNLTSGINYYRNERSPFVRVSGTVDGKAIHRTIHVGLRSSQNTSYVATERQLRAITWKAPTDPQSTTNPEANGKFEAYADTISNNKNIRLCADIVFNPNPTGTYPAFKPIIGFSGTNNGDDDEGAFGFDGSNCEICNMTIGARENAGMFDLIETDNNLGKPTIQNLILRNPTVSGSVNAGALVGKVTLAKTIIKNCSVIGGTIRLTQGGNAALSVSVGGLVGSLAGGNVQWASVTGVKIVTPQTSSAATAVTNAGLMFGSINGATIKDVYAIGDMKTVASGVETQGANAKNVGGLAGSATGCTVSGVVTSGYVGSNCNVTSGTDDEKSNVGGVFGKMSGNSNSTMSLNNMVSTAFVTGQNYFAGIVGWLDYGTISNALFAGTTSAASGNKIVYAKLHDGSSAPAGTTICYDRSLQRTDLEENYHPMSTWNIVTGTGVPFSGNGFAYDTQTYSYYPNPVNTLGEPATSDSIGNVLTSAFKVGLGFALARVNMVYAGTGGSIEEYDEITATSPISTINSIPQTVTNNGVTTVVPTSALSIGKPNSADTIKLEEYDVSNTTNQNGDTQGYLIDNGDSLSPRIWQSGAFTGVRATLNIGTGSDATFAKKNATDALSIFRFVVVNACRMTDIEYEIVYSDTAAGLDLDNDHVSHDNKVVLMLKTMQKMTSLYKNVDDPTGANAPEQAFSSNAVTSKYQDSVVIENSDASGSYTVKYRKIAVPSDSRIYVGAMLPSQYKVSDVEAYQYNFGTNAYGDNCYDIEGQGKWVYIDPSVNTAANTKVKIKVTVAADPSWGLRDLDGGIG